MPRPEARAREGTQHDATTVAAPEHTRRVTLETELIGRLVISFGDDGITCIRFARDEPREPDVLGGASAPRYLDALRRYFAGEPVSFEDVPLDLRGTPFQKKVWEALRTIPFGRVASYAHIAGRIGVPRGMRAVGLANGRNPVPIIVPCHRIVEAHGALGGFSGGLDIKRKLLTLEGVDIAGDVVRPGQRSLF